MTGATPSDPTVFIKVQHNNYDVSMIPVDVNVSWFDSSANEVHVAPVWSADVKRPSVDGWVVNQCYVDRLSKAIMANKAFKNPRVCFDIFNRTYVCFEPIVLDKDVDAALKRIGF
jgi:hypothetical protein